MTDWRSNGAASNEPASDEPARDEPARDEPASDEPASDEPADRGVGLGGAAPLSTRPEEPGARRWPR